ncbi:uncharacterized protein N0V89_004786 [Didymosphaeria variabile]|uniref:Prion-inhibition and propagation HeLo domain-containing protein n=1 Tax=Didymosphaeria variabile TaxID=1932322 RepID=A0A9W8XT59_9PLEO|nr:uncharacterized protein N0V89_004786 [Didymosphaeria variabile]KAJ4356750.1 hypothetical protein N0V89_004786 [Didymosphaeria variabile]
MTEVVGLAVGFIGLAGLFSTCVDAFKLVQICGSRTADYGVLQTMLDNQQFQLMAWGKACGFMEEDHVNPIFDDHSSAHRNRRIEDTLERIRSLLVNAEKLKEVYGLKAQRAPIGSRLIVGAPLSAFSKAFQSTKKFCNTSLQRKVRITDSIRWAVQDREKFERLVQDLRDLVDDLSKLTEDTGIASSQRIVVEYEMEMIDDEPSLEIIEAASVCDENDDLLSHAASRRLSRVRERSVAGRSVAFHDSASMVSNQHYAPSVGTLIEDDENEVLQEIGITRVAYRDWRKVKPRAELYPALKTLIVATGTSNDVSDISNGIHPLSRTNTFDGDAVASGNECPIRVAINSRTLISTLKKVLHVTGGRPIIDLENSSKTERKDTYSYEFQPEDQGSYGVISLQKYSDFAIDCFFIDHNGTSFGPRPHRIIISEYSGKRDIEALQAFPLAMCSFDSEEFVDLHERGRRYVQYLEGIPRLQYHGPVLSCTDVFDDSLLDLNARDQFIRSCKSLRDLKGDQLDATQLQLLPFRLCGLVLQKLQLRDTQASDLSLDDLVLPDHQKSILTSVINGQLRGVLTSYSTGRNGLVLLFSGPNGAGKTVTAETLAASLDMPLMTLNIADLEGTPKEAERNITSQFSQAKRCGCILFMRRADLVLEGRRRVDREGNIMAAAFRSALAHL